MTTEHSFGTSYYVTLENGRKLHYMIKGHGDITVVFETGMGFSRSTWGLVQPIVSQHTRAVVYDRAGYGKSDPNPAPRTLHQMARDLNKLLDELGEGPFLLVGHSWGGPIVRTAAALKPSRIKGILLIDPSDEHCDLYFSRLARMNFAIQRALLPAMARTGLYRKLGSKPGSVQPIDVAADHAREDFTIQAVQTMNAESRQMLSELTQLKQRPPGLGELDVRIISGTLLTGAERSIRPAIMKAHQQSVAALPNGRWIEASNSGHMVIFSEPQLIVQEIMDMLGSEAGMLETEEDRLETEPDMFESEA